MSNQKLIKEYEDNTEEAYDVLDSYIGKNIAYILNATSLVQGLDVETNDEIIIKELVKKAWEEALEIEGYLPRVRNPKKLLITPIRGIRWMLIESYKRSVNVFQSIPESKYYNYDEIVNHADQIVWSLARALWVLDDSSLTSKEYAKELDASIF